MERGVNDQPLTAAQLLTVRTKTGAKGPRRAPAAPLLSAANPPATTPTSAGSSSTPQSPTAASSAAPSSPAAVNGSEHNGSDSERSKTTGSSSSPSPETEHATVLPSEGIGFAEAWRNAFRDLSQRSTDELIKRYHELLGPELHERMRDGITTNLYRDPLVPRVYAKKFGEKIPSPTDTVLSNNDTVQIISIVAHLNKQQLDEHNLDVQGSIPDVFGRFTAALPDLSSGPMFSMRLFISNTAALNDYVPGHASQEQINAIRTLVEKNYNILIVAPQGFGKTHLARAILNEVQERFGSRLGVMEDNYETILNRPNYYTLFARPGSKYDYRKIIELNLRFGAESLSMGEVRSHAFDLIEVMTTGNMRTSVATIHGRTVEEGLMRLQILIKQEGKDADPRFIIGAIKGVITMNSIDGTPRIHEVVELTGASASGFTKRQLA